MTKRSVTKKPKLTQWFDGSVKPVRDGVYLRMFAEGDEFFSKFKNGKWFVNGSTVRRASLSEFVSPLQSIEWRGLAQNPEVQP